MSCDHDCARPPDFPRKIENRRGLDTIDYRIGDFGSMRAHILSRIDAAPELARWTHRGTDDPGIALAESAAIVGDILAFYHQVYANEAYLRTAKWRESVSDLVRVLGYRLAPGLGGVARFALAVKGDRPVRIPAGFAIGAEVTSSSKPATFETTAELEAIPALSKFRLYRRRQAAPIVNGDDTFEFAASLALKAGDRILVGTGDALALSRFQILVIDAVSESFGVRHMRTRGRIACLQGEARFLRAFKLRSSARHVGHDSPGTRVRIDSNGHAHEEGVGFDRPLDVSHGDPASDVLAPVELPLDGEANDFAAGTRVLVEAELASPRTGRSAWRVLERSIVAMRRQTFGWGASSGDCAVIELAANLTLTEAGTTMRVADIRSITAHAVEGASFVLARVVPSADVEGNVLEYYGRREDASALACRQLLLSLPGGPAIANVTAVSVGVVSRPGLRFFGVTLDQRLSYSLFSHDAPQVDVYGNLVQATEGKSESEVPIGDGDSRAVFQTFEIPKAPLTYLLDPAAPAPRSPQLEIWVDRIKWRRVESLFGAGHRDAIYIVREGEDGRSFVQFGDGRTGARLSSGRGNVVARFRTGTGAHGRLAPDKKPSAARKVPGLDDLWMLEPATIGCAPESAWAAQAAAPVTMQSLGRIVSLADYEAEALSLPGVLKARAAWTSVDGLSEITVTILTASGTPQDAAAIELALRRALAARGPARCALRVRSGVRRPVQVGLLVAYDEMRRSDDVAAAIAAALGIEDDDPADDVDPGRRGLLHRRMRNFGEGVHGSQVLGAVQNVRGVAWVKVVRLAYAASQAARFFHVPLLLPAALRAPAAPERATLRAMPHEMLSLARRDLSIDFVRVGAEEVHG